MAKKGNSVSINRSGETIKVEIKDQNYRVMHRGTYRLRLEKDFYNLLSILEKFSPHSISKIINMKHNWI